MSNGIDTSDYILTRIRRAGEELAQAGFSKGWELVVDGEDFRSVLRELRITAEEGNRILIPTKAGPCTVRWKRGKELLEDDG